MTGPTEVALNPAELAAAQIDPSRLPDAGQLTLDEPADTGPDWIVIGSEGGFLPAPVVVDGQQPTTWIIDPTVFDVGNVDQHSLLLAPAERVDVIVDFSQFAGQTLILYNDAPAAFPARVASYDYYTGGPDLSPVGAPTILPGYGPNTRTIMQVKVAAPNTGPGPVRPDRAARRVRAQSGRLGRVRVRPAPDHRRAGRLQLGLRHELRRQRLVQRPAAAPARSATGTPGSQSRAASCSGSTRSS